MRDHPDKPGTNVALIQLLPNMLTIAAICAGMSAIRFGVQGSYTLAAQLILAAAILDGLDGRLARRLGADSKMGAELDSLADFLNFGVAPPLVLYFWALQDMRGAWIAVLLFAVCCVIRLARFNVSGKSDDVTPDRSYFVGVPSPAGALLVMFPMYVSFAFKDSRLLPDAIICLHMIAVGFLMISHIPTWSFKTTRISRENVKYFLVGFAFVGAAVLTYAWTTLVAICLGYVGVVIWALIKNKKTIFKRGK
ncbi:CDP-diacylglycerol--serine O-phosphatidyltransferase [Roseovarius aestuarii]|uniref:CDP-diacylglycerol--serine O-phosphatidyltransferase n=1 Tax=Roseovarius aestuarii TaxID=475083 RepID=A0A1X7BY27_9RHOB|nr:CDP-diacylglycerol--serine O-phosphatidyltransferase [Roseovarius aestuarii]SMC14508.1 Phosphatidylcholine synthase [Roseovarius aestuarii]